MGGAVSSFFFLSPLPRLVSSCCSQDHPEIRTPGFAGLWTAGKSKKDEKNDKTGFWSMVGMTPEEERPNPWDLKVGHQSVSNINIEIEIDMCVF
jgi:hypothetical protein